jgi:hypothetical protein
MGSRKKTIETEGRKSLLDAFQLVATIIIIKVNS